jgi:phosphoribosylglycinamide formyltransferase-1
MNKRSSVVVLISGRGSNLAALTKACGGPDYPATITKVISDRADAPGLEIARAGGIEAFVFERDNFSSKAFHEAAILDELEKSRPDLICLAGYMRILSGKFVRCYEGKILNIHPSLLPKYPGLDTHARALNAGDSEHGCTVHFVSEVLDGGTIVARKVVKIEPGENENSLAEKVLKVEHALYVDAVRKVLSQAT